jgi:hypothetical protein
MGSLVSNLLGVLDVEIVLNSLANGRSVLTALSIVVEYSPGYYEASKVANYISSNPVLIVTLISYLVVKDTL